MELYGRKQQKGELEYGGIAYLRKCGRRQKETERHDVRGDFLGGTRLQ